MRCEGIGFTARRMGRRWRGLEGQNACGAWSVAGYGGRVRWLIGDVAECRATSRSTPTVLSGVLTSTPSLVARAPPYCPSLCRHRVSPSRHPASAPSVIRCSFFSPLPFCLFQSSLPWPQSLTHPCCTSVFPFCLSSASVSAFPFSFLPSPPPSFLFFPLWALGYQCGDSILYFFEGHFFSPVSLVVRRCATFVPSCSELTAPLFLFFSLPGPWFEFWFYFSLISFRGYFAVMQFALKRARLSSWYPTSPPLSKR